jgi:hypothetical protein
MVVGTLTLILCAADVGAQDRSDKPWRGRISAGGGWNSNPAAIGTTVSFGTPTSGVPFVNNQDAAFSRITFDGSYDLIQTEKDLLTVGL